jgi:hypothetical protein
MQAGFFSRREGDMLERLTKETFAEHLGSTFRLHYGAAQPLGVELTEARPLGAVSRGPIERAPFALLFRGPRQPVLPQQIYPLEHERLGTLEIFLVPVGPDAAGMQYEAVFT